MNNSNKSKIIISVIGVISLVIIVGASTYAWFKWRTSLEQTVNVNLTATSVITFVGGSHINGYLDPAFEYSGGNKKDIKITSELPGSTFNLYLKVKAIPEELQGEYFLWAIYKGSEYINGGDFSEVNAGDDVTLFENRTIPVDVYDTYSLYLWLDAEEDFTTDIMNKVVDFDLYATGDSGSVNELG